MTVTIIRHGRVNHIWIKSCNSSEFDEECRAYDEAPIEGIENAKGPDADKVYVSELSRTHQTAKMMFGDREFTATELINEVPLRSAFDTKHRLPLWFWNTLGRLQWLFGSKRQPEPRFQTRERAERFAEQLIETDEDCAVVTHGFYMHTLIAVMKQKGLKADKGSIHYKNGEWVVLKKGK